MKDEICIHIGYNQTIRGVDEDKSLNRKQNRWCEVKFSEPTNKKKHATTLLSWCGSGHSVQTCVKYKTFEHAMISSMTLSYIANRLLDIYFNEPKNKVFIDNLNLVLSKTQIEIKANWKQMQVLKTQISSLTQKILPNQSEELMQFFQSCTFDLDILNFLQGLDLTKIQHLGSPFKNVMPNGLVELPKNNKYDKFSAMPLIQILDNYLDMETQIAQKSESTFLDKMITEVMSFSTKMHQIHQDSQQK